MKPNIFITGANGFIGQNLINYLSEKGFNVHALIREGTIPKFNLNKNIRICYGNLLDIESLRLLVPKRSIIINLAANPYHPKLSFLVNVRGVDNLLKVSKEKVVIKFIQMSTQATKLVLKGNYATTKEWADRLITASNLNYIILKPSLVYGEGEEGLFNKIKRLLSRSNYIPVFGDGNTHLNPIFIDDLCFYIEKIIEDLEIKNTTFDIGSLESITYNEFYAKLISIFNPKAKIIHIPKFVGLLAGYFFNYFNDPPFRIDNILGSTQETKCDGRLIANRYHHKPLSLKNAIKKIYGQKFKVGIIGLGKMGMLHSTILNTFKDVKVAAFIEPNQNIHPTIKSMFGTKSIYKNLEDALKKEKLDAVFITTPTFTHKQLTTIASNHKLKVFVEKPLCLNTDDLNYYKTQDYNLQVGYTLLFSRTFRKVKELIDRQTYGKVQSFEAYCLHSEVLEQKRGWPYQKSKSGGGVLMNPGPHIFSLINLYFGTPKSVKSHLESLYSKDVEDKAQVQLAYNYFKGTVGLNWSVLNQLISDNSLLINFDKAKVFVNNQRIEITTDNYRTLLLEADIKPLFDKIFNLNPEANGESYYVEDRIFIDSLHKNMTVLSNLNFALDTEDIIFKAYKNVK